MDTLKCSVCEKELKSSMEIEYSSWINEFFCSPKCATDRYFNYMESLPVDFDNELPEGVIVNDAGVLVRAVEQPRALDGFTGTHNHPILAKCTCPGCVARRAAASNA